jgi:hypothetical protein
LIDAAVDLLQAEESQRSAHAFIIYENPLPYFH